MPKLVDLLDAIAPENLINYRYGWINQTANTTKLKPRVHFTKEPQQSEIVYFHLYIGNDPQWFKKQ